MGFKCVLCDVLSIIVSIKQNTLPPFFTHHGTYPHVELRVARHHQYIGYRVHRAVLVQQAEIGANFGRKEWVEGLLMEHIIDVATGLVGTRISEEGEENLCVIQLKL